MAQVIRYIDPDAPGPAHDGTSWNDAYLSIAAWNTGEATDLVSDGDYHTVYCRASGGTADTTYLLPTAGWNTGAANFDNTAYRIFNDDWFYAILSNANTCYLRIKNIQIEVSDNGTWYRDGIHFDSAAADTNNDLRVEQCIIKGNYTNAVSGYGIRVSWGYMNVKIWNTTIYGFVNSSDTDFRGIYSDYANDLDIYNCTIYGNYYGVHVANGINGNLKNCAIGNNTDDVAFSAGMTIDYCCSDDGDGTNSQAPSGGDWDNEMNDPDNGDFTIIAGGNCVENGVNDPGTGLYSDDIIGTARS